MMSSKWLRWWAVSAALIAAAGTLLAAAPESTLPGEPALAELRTETAQLVNVYAASHSLESSTLPPPSTTAVYSELARRSAAQSSAERARATQALKASRALWLAGDYSAAKIGLMATLRLDPANAEANFYLGSCLLHEGNKSGAAEFMLRAQHFGGDGSIAWRAAAALELLPSAPPEAASRAGEPSVLWRARDTISTLRDCPQCPALTIIPAGEYTMGSPVSEAARSEEEWAHRVRIGYALAIGTFPVTRDEYAAFVSESARADEPGCFMMNDALQRPADTPGRNWHEVGFVQSGRDPVVCVTAEDAQAYVEWLSRKTGHHYRLLSESEFEYAARGGTSTAYWWGDGPGVARARCANCGGQSRIPSLPVAGPPAADPSAAALPSSPMSTAAIPAPAGGPPFQSSGTVAVGQYAANPFGLFDMNGNVYEWVADCYHDGYVGAPVDGSARLDEGGCLHHMVRGGSWINTSDQLRSAYRFVIMSPNTAHNHVGFRVARDL